MEFGIDKKELTPTLVDAIVNFAQPEKQRALRRIEW